MQPPILPNKPITVAQTPEDLLVQVLDLLSFAKGQIERAIEVSSDDELRSREHVQTLKQIVNRLQVGTGWIQLACSDVHQYLPKPEENSEQ